MHRSLPISLHHLSWALSPYIAKDLLTQDSDDSGDELVGTSQPDEEYLLPYIPLDDIVDSSQPFEDGEEDLQLNVSETTPPIAVSASPCESDPDSHDDDTRAIYIRARRARLVRRVPIPEPACTPPASTSTPVKPGANPFRRLSLVHRVTTPSEASLRSLELLRKRKRAHAKARRIVKKIKSLATATHKLQRQHRELRVFLYGKENIF